MTVDVVIPAYERKELLREAVESVLAQTYNNFTLFIVDDASPTPLVHNWRISDSRLRFVRLIKNEGPGRARNAGVKEGNAPLIAFLDSDDLWHKDKLRAQVDFFRKNTSAEWVHTHEVWFRNGKEVKQKKEYRKEGGQFLTRAFERCLISPSSVVMRRSFFESVGGFEPHFYCCEDYELWLRLLLRAPIGYIDEPLTIKRAGAWSQLSQTPVLDRLRVLALHRFYRQLRNESTKQEYILPLLQEAEKKCTILLKGALKRNNNTQVTQYQAWLTLFNTRRTLLIR
ncbi:MAG TPA: glycosyltransferase family A protein [Turneriella sp.]|nr:glycosyltransferase family A protein [Turneriella sp.]